MTTILLLCNEGRGDGVMTTILLLCNEGTDACD